MNQDKKSKARRQEKVKERKKEKQLSGFKTWRLNTASKFQRTQDKVKDFFLWFEVWRASLKEVEGQFGTAVVSFFVFVKWMLYLNIGIFLLILSFVVIPQVILNDKHYNNYEFSEPVIHDCSNYYTNYVQNQTISSSSNVIKYVVDFLEGTGFMEDTVLFYGFYIYMSPNETELEMKTTSTFDISYNMSLAYLWTAFACFFLSVFVVARRAGDGFKQNMLEKEGHQCKYSQMVFTGWDFSLTDSNNANLKHKSVIFEISGDLLEEERKERQAMMKTTEKIKLYTIRTIINVIIIAIGVGALYGIVKVTLYSIQALSEDLSGILSFTISYLPSITVTVINSIVPILFGILVKVEKYSPSVEINITLGRTVLLRLASLAVLIGSIIPRITNCEQGNSAPIKEYCEVCEETIQCWETYIGQELYKLCITDFAAVIGVILFYEFPRRLITRYFECGITKILGDMEFELPKNVLAIVYSQAICWLGAFFCPFIPLMTALKFFIVFYFKKWSLLYNMVPSARPYKASRSGFFFMVILLVTFLLCFAPVVCAMTLMDPSKGCGPFRGLDTMWTSFTIAFQEWPDSIQSVVNYSISSGIFVPVVVLTLSLLMYYYSVAAAAQEAIINQLKEQLVMEGRDKHFLLMQMQEIVPSVRKSLRQQRLASEDTGTLRGRRQAAYQRASVRDSMYEDELVVSSTVEMTGQNEESDLYLSDYD